MEYRPFCRWGGGNILRKAINADKDNFYVSRKFVGKILAMEYALKYQKNLKGLLV